MIENLTKKTIETAPILGKTYNIHSPFLRGFFLQVRKNGRKFFYYRNRSNGVDMRVKLGEYPILSIKEAQKKAMMISEDVVSMRFDSILEMWLDHKAISLKPMSMKAYENFANKLLPLFKCATLTEQPTYFYSKIKATKESEKNKARMFAFLLDICTFARSRGLINSNPLDGVKQSIVFNAGEKKPMKSISRNNISEFIECLFSRYNSVGACLFVMFIAMTLLRKSEALGLMWSDVDFDGKIINIPKRRMKNGLNHSIPICDTTIKILMYFYTLKDETNKVFHHVTRSSTPICRAIKFKENFTFHGFRHLGSTILHDEGFNHDLVEKQLSHLTGTAVSRIYNKSSLIEQRREMMQWYEGYLVAQHDFTKYIPTLQAPDN